MLMGSLGECSPSSTIQSKPEPATISVQYGLASETQRPTCCRPAAIACLKELAGNSICAIRIRTLGGKRILAHRNPALFHPRRKCLIAAQRVDEGNSGCKNQRKEQPM